MHNKLPPLSDQEFSQLQKYNEHSITTAAEMMLKWKTLTLVMKVGSKLPPTLYSSFASNSQVCLLQ